MCYFVIENHDSSDKQFDILTPFENLKLSVDYDDVWHEEADSLAVAVVKCLNENFHQYFSADDVGK